MIKDFEKLKRNYAKLIVNRGIVETKDRIIYIYADIDQPDFVNTLVEECYNSNAKRVVVKWTYRKIDRMIKEKTALKDLDILLPTEKEEIKYLIKENVATIRLESENPNYLKGVDANKILAGFRLKKDLATKCRKGSQYRAPFTIACVPSVSWAKEIFPKLKEKDAVEKLWKIIFKVCYIDNKSATKGWDSHCKAIDDRAKWLNSLKIKELHYTSKNGTDVIVGMTDNYQFAGTADYDILSKKKYYSNIPTEECFVSPHKDKINGVICSSMPFSNDGQIIDGLKITLKNGRIIKASAKKGLKVLQGIINTDEGSHYIGEAALVPYNSPIRNTGVLFINTLFDENAACHFAIGGSYSYTYKGYENMTTKQLFEKGLNESAIHCDFMIGTSDLNIVATTYDNKKIQIFKNGNWAK